MNYSQQEEQQQWMLLWIVNFITTIKIIAVDSVTIALRDR